MGRDYDYSLYIMSTRLSVSGEKNSKFTGENQLLFFFIVFSGKFKKDIPFVKVILSENSVLI